MTAQADAPLVSLLRSLSKVSGNIAGLIGGLVLAGWILNVPFLKSIFPGTPQMVPNTALAFILTGASLRMLLSAETSSQNQKRHIAQLCAIASGILAILTLAEHTLDLNLGIDQLPHMNTETAETAYPGRMSPHTALTFILVSMALLFIDVKNRTLQAQSLALAGCVIALLAFAGYAYGVPFLFSIPNATGMALHTSLSFMVLCQGILFARPDQGFMTLITSKTTGGFVARRFIPIAITVPLALGWVRLKGEQAGYYSTEAGLLLFATSNILILTSVIWWYSRSLDRTDWERKRSEKEIRLLQTITQGITEAEDFDSAVIVVLQKVCETTGWTLGEVWLPSPDGSSLQCSPSWYSRIKGLDKFRQESAGFRFQKGVGLPGRVWSSKRSAWIPDVTEDPNFPRVLLAKEVGLKAGMAIPVLAGTEAVAVMDFFVMEPRKEDERLVGLIATIAAQLGTVFQRKQAEQSLRESEERFRQVVENIREVLWMKDVRHNQIIYVNPAYQEIWGRSCESLYASPDSWLEAVYPIDRKRIMEATLSRQVQGTYEEVYRIMQSDGTYRWIAERAFPVKDESGEVCRVVGIAEDITERKMIEDQLHHAQKMEIIGRLAGGVAHDFNNILTAIIGYANLLQMKMQEDDPLKLNVEPILAASEKAATLTRSLLAFSRKQVLNPEPVNLNDIIRRLKRLLLRLIGEEIRLNIELADEDLVVMADSMQMDQVLMNLALNARDAMPDEGLLTIATETIALDDKFIAAHGYGTPGMYALLSVTDTGTGMDGKTRERIFEPFFTTKEVGKGTGLGLALVYGIVKQHEGYINVYSEPGEGTIFKIYLPLIQAAARELRPRMPAIPVEGSETILIAEDDATVRKLISSMLEEFGYTVIEAVDGNEAIQKFMENKDRIQLMILDVIMPHKSGKTVYNEICKVSPAMKALFMSGYTVYTVKDKGVIEDEGANFLSKPVSPSELLRKVREVLDKT